ncbi:MAG: 3-oxoacyl-ACP reductase FabG [Synergistaceae bacterium]|nr:3-oxoacyl-ACP reductase FabG [Synergistaceae bacterium]
MSSTSSNKLLEGKSAIITGSTRGIGRAIAKAFADNGASLVLNGSKLTSKPDIECVYVAGDISELETSIKLADECMKNFGKIDILVNNAGINTRTKFLELDPSEWQKVLQVNLTGTFYACKSVIPHMLEQKFGSIINLSSTAGKTAHPNASLCYGVSKAGIDSLTRKLAYDFAPSGIRVNSICPGPVETDMSLQWTQDYREKIISDIPLRRLGTPEDIANLAVFLASDLSSFITGESININGGKYMN